MAIYFQVRKRVTPQSTGKDVPSIEVTEHIITCLRVTPKDVTESPTIYLDGKPYDFNRFDSIGSAMYVRDEMPVT